MRTAPPILSEVERTTEQEAIEFARGHKKEIATRLTDTNKYLPESEPVSVFMAGSPGAGKTEASIELLARFPSQLIVRIDPDELRTEFPEYMGTNAWLFQKAVSILVDSIHDRVLTQEQSFILDGTLANYDLAKKNMERSLKRGRTVQLISTPSWLGVSFRRARQQKEGGFVRNTLSINTLRHAKSLTG